MVVLQKSGGINFSLESLLVVECAQATTWDNLDSNELVLTFVIRLVNMGKSAMTNEHAQLVLPDREREYQRGFCHLNFLIYTLLPVMKLIYTNLNAK